MRKEAEAEVSVPSDSTPHVINLFMMVKVLFLGISVVMAYTWT